MNALTDYRALLVEGGLPETAADFITAKRADKRNRAPAGSIRAEKTEDGNAELLIYDTIGFDFWTGGGVTPKGLIEQLESLKPFDRLTVRMNSPGGDVFDGMAIFNILRRQEAKVSVEIEGWAASAASFIAQAADAGELRISEAGMMMVHRAWGVSVGNTNDMLEMADVLDKLDGQIALIYANRSKRKTDTWLGIMNSETWFTGAEAVDAKLADATIAAKRVAAFDVSGFGYRNSPANKKIGQIEDAGRTWDIYVHEGFQYYVAAGESFEADLAIARRKAGLPPFCPSLNDKAEEAKDEPKQPDPRVAARLKVLEMDEEAA